MKIFLDTANIDEILKASKRGVIDGVTTNPTLMAQEKTVHDIAEHITKIGQIVNGPVSIEVISTTPSEIIDEAKQIVKIAPNAVIKVPMTYNGLAAVRVLTSLGIQTNVTLVFSLNQALLAAKAGPTYISIFVGRLDDIGIDGIEIVRKTRIMLDTYHYPTEIISASIRHPKHVSDAALAGTHAVTIPPQVLEKMFSHPLTDLGLAQFLRDWERKYQLKA